MRLTKRLAAAMGPNRGSIATDTKLPERPLARRVLAFFPALPALCVLLLVIIQQWRGGERSLLPLTAFTRFQLPIRLPRWFVGPGPRRGFGEAGQRDRGFVIFSASLSSLASTLPSKGTTPFAHPRTAYAYWMEGLRRARGLLLTHPRGMRLTKR